MAERVLQGQLPHRDFVDTYTGGLTFFYAGVFWLFGTDLLWLRVAMLPFFVAFVIATFYIATRIAPPLVAAVLTVAIVIWSVPNYSAAMPSWFNLYFAILRASLRWCAGSSHGSNGGSGLPDSWAVSRSPSRSSACTTSPEPRSSCSSGRNSERNPAVRRVTAGAAAIAVLALLCFGSVLDVLWPRLGHGELVALLVPVAAALSGVALIAIRTNPPTAVRRPDVHLRRRSSARRGGGAAPRVSRALPGHRLGRLSGSRPRPVTRAPAAVRGAPAARAAVVSCRACRSCSSQSRR